MDTLQQQQHVDILSEMRKGARLLKLYSRGTKSHWRDFSLDKNNSSIRWVSSQKDVSDTTIKISNISEIIVHNFDIAKKFQDTKPEELSMPLYELQKRQFTIKYMEHNKSFALPQLSPNNSATNTVFGSSKNSIITPRDMRSHHPKNSNSFIRALRAANGHSKQTSLIPSDQNSKSFWKNWTKSSKNKQDDSKEKSDEKEHEISTNDTNEFTQSQSFHQLELYLLAENFEIATIWIYGLERLIQLSKNGMDTQFRSFQISRNELMKYSKIGDTENNIINITPFKLQLDKVQTALNGIIETLPSSQRMLLDHFGVGNENRLVRKIRKDKKSLEDLCLDFQISKGRVDESTMNEWMYILKRVEINIGGYKVALRNLKAIQMETHRRHRSKSSTYHFRDQISSPYVDKRAMLKDRSPRTPNLDFDQKMQEAMNEMSMEQSYG